MCLLVITEQQIDHLLRGTNYKLQVICGSSEPERLWYPCGGEAGAARAVRGNVWCEWRKQFGQAQARRFCRRPGDL